MGNAQNIPTVQFNPKVWRCSLDSSLPSANNEWHTSPSFLIEKLSTNSSFTISARFDARRNLSVVIRLRKIPPSFSAESAEIFLIYDKSTSAGEFRDSKTFSLYGNSQPSECGQAFFFTFDEFQTSSYPSSSKILIEIIGCTIRWYDTTNQKHSQPSVYDMKPYLNNPEFSDVTLVVKGHELPAHKIVLASQSPVFAAMFTVPMRESLENRVQLPDVDVDTLMVILEYLYTGECINMNDSGILWKALNVAQMYEMDGVRKMCERQFMKSLTIDDITNMLDTIDDNPRIFCKVILKNNLLISRKAPQYPVEFRELIEVFVRGIDFEEVDIAVIKIALNCWYTGQLDKLLKADVLWRVFAFAKKYDMREGRNFCERKLPDLINFENVVDMLEKADDHQLTVVFWRAVELASRRTEILQRHDFKELCRLRPNVAVEFPESRWRPR